MKKIDSDVRKLQSLICNFLPKWYPELDFRPTTVRFSAAKDYRWSRHLIYEVCNPIGVLLKTILVKLPRLHDKSGRIQSTLVPPIMRLNRNITVYGFYISILGTMRRVTSLPFGHYQFLQRPMHCSLSTKQVLHFIPPFSVQLVHFQRPLIWSESPDQLGKLEGS